jgi:hypothetical protein
MADKKAKLSDFQTQRRNTNKHKPRGMGMLDSVIAKEGWIGAITTAANNETFAGSARLETAQGRFGDEFEPIVFDIDGTRPVVLRRIDIPTADDPRAIRLGIGDNRIHEVNSDPDAELLALLVDEGNDISDMYFDDELAALVAMDQQQNVIDKVNDIENNEWVGMPEFEVHEDIPKLIISFETEEERNNFTKTFDIQVRTTNGKAWSTWYPYKEREDLKSQRYE